MSDLLNKDALLAAAERPDVQTKDVHVPELGGFVRVREMSGTVRNRIEAAAVSMRAGGDAKTLDNVTAQMIAACLVDEHDRPMLTTADVRRLMASRPRAVFRIRDAIMEISATDDDDVEALAEVFDSARSDSSTSA